MDSFTNFHAEDTKEDHHNKIDDLRLSHERNVKNDSISAMLDKMTLSTPARTLVSSPVAQREVQTFGEVLTRTPTTPFPAESFVASCEEEGCLEEGPLGEEEEDLPVPSGGLSGSKSQSDISKEIFKDSSSVDFLSQHGDKKQGEVSRAAVLARESLYTQFDPLISGRQSIMPPKASIVLEEDDDNLIAMTSPKNISSASTKEMILPIIPTNSPNGGMTKSSHKEKSISALKNIAIATTWESGVTGSSTPKSIPDENPGASGDNESMQNNITSGIPASAIKLKEFEFQENLLKKDAILSEMMRTVESLEVERDHLTIEINARRESEDQLKQIICEYDKTINDLIANKELEKSNYGREKSVLENEKNQVMQDLQAVESAFADLHKKYERTKATIEGFKQNEDTLKKYLEDCTNKLHSQEERYERLKVNAEQTLEKANKEIDNASRSQEAEIARLTAMLKRSEMKSNQLERTVEQAMKDKHELTQVCDDLIAQVGRK